jgi:SAM-dependent methyltransferase
MSEARTASPGAPGAPRDDDARSQAGTQRSYERIPYRSRPWPISAPEHLHTRALLHGLDAARPDACRVLELGCADGGNLLPLAAHHPDASFVGIDLAKGHIDQARADSEQLALSNARFDACSFVDLDDVLRDVAPFDYVVAHGLMSWVTPTLQDELFRVVRRWLAPDAVALISYNTYPGWAGRRSIRELLLQHSRGVDDVEERVARSRELLELLAATVPSLERGYTELIQEVLQIASDPERLDYSAHEYLEDENHPFFLRDFVARAEAGGLRYVADADIPDMQPETMPEEVDASRLDRVERLQLQDLMTNRRFRQSVLCRDDAEVNERPRLSLVQQMYVSTELSPHGEPSPSDPEALASTLAQLHLSGMATLRATAPGWAAEPGERPVASPLVRAHSDPGRPTTSLRHHSLALESATVRELLTLLDGSRDRAALIRHFAGRLDADEIEQILGLAAQKALLLPEPG